MHINLTQFTNFIPNLPNLHCMCQIAHVTHVDTLSICPTGLSTSAHVGGVVSLRQLSLRFKPLARCSFIRRASDLHPDFRLSTTRSRGCRSCRPATCRSWFRPGFSSLYHTTLPPLAGIIRVTRPPTADPTHPLQRHPGILFRYYGP